MDSLMAVEFRNRLNRALTGACTVSNTVVFDYPDIEVLARHLDGEIGEVDAASAPQAESGEEPTARLQLAQPAQPTPQAQAVPQVQPTPQVEPTPLVESARQAVPALQESPAPQLQPLPERQPASRHDEDQVAIVGMACRFPGAPDLSAYWRLLEAGADLVTDGRRDPGPWNGIIGDPEAKEPTYRRGGFVEELDRFDARFFGIRPIEARMMDPRQRMLLETSWHALEDAGIDPGPLKGSRAGVFAGLGGSEYRDLIAAAGKDDSYLGTAASVAIGRVAFALGLMGPAVPLDMTCASSLVAVHQAAASLRQGEVDLALAGGVHVILSPPVMRFHEGIRDVVADRSVQDIRRLGRRVRARRGLRHGGPEAAERRGGGRRPHLGRRSGLRSQPERCSRGAHGTQRNGPGAVVRGDAVTGGNGALRR